VLRKKLLKVIKMLPEGGKERRQKASKASKNAHFKKPFRE
jgi:hypothetical protein